MCNLSGSSCSLKIHITGTFVERTSMRNEDIVEAMRQMKLNFKQHTDNQFVVYTKIMEQYMSSTDQHFGQLHQEAHELLKRKATSTSASSPDTKQDLMGDEGVETPLTNSRGATTPDLASLLKVLKVDIPRFNGQNVYNWVYTIEKFLLYIPYLLSFGCK